MNDRRDDDDEETRVAVVDEREGATAARRATAGRIDAEGAATTRTPADERRDEIIVLGIDRRGGSWRRKDGFGIERVVFFFLFSFFRSLPFKNRLTTAEESESSKIFNWLVDLPFLSLPLSAFSSLVLFRS